MGRRNDLGEWEKMCLGCGEIFYYDLKPGNSPDYCSNACKQRAYRNRKHKQSENNITVRVGMDDESIRLFINQGRFILSLDDVDTLMERLAKARRLLRAEQMRF